MKSKLKEITTSLQDVTEFNDVRLTDSNTVTFEWSVNGFGELDFELIGDEDTNTIGMVGEAPSSVVNKLKSAGFEQVEGNCLLLKL